MVRRSSRTGYHKGARKVQLGRYDGPQASPVKITHADGTVEIEPAKPVVQDPRDRKPKTKRKRTR